jgi:hypothetical protein
VRHTLRYCTHARHSSVRQLYGRALLLFNEVSSSRRMFNIVSNFFLSNYASLSNDDAGSEKLCIWYRIALHHSKLKVNRMPLIQATRVRKLRHCHLCHCSTRADPVLRPEAENMSALCSREQVASLGGKKQKHSRLASRDQRHLFCFLRLSFGGTGRPPRLPTLSWEMTSLQ